MASLISKRQQARNEKTLQELLHKVPGNNLCADCGARNPAWASWSLGIFLCMRCASIHRKLGTHISKVKSLTMDGWSNDQVENMKRVGNVASNKIYNPENKRPDIPIDADEADSAMERFIRAKYVQHNTTPVNGTRRHNTGSTESDEGTPPPLPPKTGLKFFKPLSFRSKKTSHHGDGARSQPEELRSKPSKVFGASVHQDSPEDTARKLTQLRDMGFMDDKRNAMVLKGVNGNLEKTVEALVRLGEGGGGSSSLAAPRQNSLSIPRTLTPAPTTPVRPRTAGITSTSPPPSHSPATSSNNPFDMPPAPPQSSQSTGTLQNKNPFYAVNYSNNPFGMPTPQADQSLNQSLQNLSLAPPQPQLFPHHTGGLPVAQPVQQTVYQQPITPPISQAQNIASATYNNNQMYPQVVQQPSQSYNPFLQPQPTQQPLTVNTSPFSTQPTQASYGSNPFQRSPTRIASPTLNQIPEQSQQNFYGVPQPAFGNNPFFNTSQPAPQQIPQPQPVQPFDQAFFQPQPQLQQMQQQPTPEPQMAYQPQFRDKNSIMALYNYPSVAPKPMQQLDQTGQAVSMIQATVPGQVPQTAPAQGVPQTLPGTNNPFLSGGAGSAPNAPSATPLGGSRSRESVNLGMEMAWNNGRHSPDAFASLSARSGL